jgi:hypothetical protein
MSAKTPENPPHRHVPLRWLPLFSAFLGEKFFSNGCISTGGGRNCLVGNSKNTVFGLENRRKKL